MFLSELLTELGDFHDQYGDLPVRLTSDNNVDGELEIVAGWVDSSGEVIGEDFDDADEIEQDQAQFVVAIVPQQ